MGVAIGIAHAHACMFTERKEMMATTCTRTFGKLLLDKCCLASGNVATFTILTLLLSCCHTVLRGPKKKCYAPLSFHVCHAHKIFADKTFVCPMRGQRAWLKLCAWGKSTYAPEGENYVYTFLFCFAFFSSSGPRL